MYNILYSNILYVYYMYTYEITLQYQKQYEIGPVKASEKMLFCERVYVTPTRPCLARNLLKAEPEARIKMLILYLRIAS